MMKHENLIFREAEHRDEPEIWKLYRAQLGLPGCAWDETYPARENISDDLTIHSLYCLTDSAGKMLGAGTIRLCPEHSELPFWNPRMHHPCDLMRICILPEKQSCGLGSLLLRQLLVAAVRSGYDGMRILVSRTNPPALRLYEKAGAVFCGETRMYEIGWRCCEIVFPAKKS